MDAALVVIVAMVAVLVVSVLVKSVAVVPQGKAGLVERLGRYQRTLPGGLSLVAPFVDKVRLVDTAERVLSLHPRVVTKDNRAVAIEPVLHVEVVDPVRATYEVADYAQALAKLAEHTLQAAVREMDLGETVGGRVELERMLQRAYHPRVREWGLEINQIVLGEIRPL